MSTILPIENMSTADLVSHSESIPEPAWHAEVLAEREEAVERGEAVFDDWRSVRTRLSDQFLGA